MTPTERDRVLAAALGKFKPTCPPCARAGALEQIASMELDLAEEELARRMRLPH